ncbi:MAG: hypothetical protein WED09_07610 [Homoserinimonas sp.]
MQLPIDDMREYFWIPEGAEYELNADPATRAFVREAAERMLRAAG